MKKIEISNLFQLVVDKSFSSGNFWRVLINLNFIATNHQFLELLPLLPKGQKKRKFYGKHIKTWKK